MCVSARLAHMHESICIPPRCGGVGGWGDVSRSVSSVARLAV